MNITYHMVPRRYFESLDPAKDYVPAAFAKDGFIDCTDGEFMVSGIAFNIFRGIQDDLLLLFIDKDRVAAEVRFDDAEKFFPHIYGPLNRDAIVKVSMMLKDRKGDWIFPTDQMPAS